MELLQELRALRRDLDELGDSVASALVESAEPCFQAWRFKEGERFLEQALSRVQESLHEPAPPPARSAARWFNTCAMAVAC